MNSQPDHFNNYSNWRRKAFLLFAYSLLRLISAHLSTPTDLRKGCVVLIICLKRFEISHEKVHFIPFIGLRFYCYVKSHSVEHRSCNNLGMPLCPKNKSKFVNQFLYILLFTWGNKLSFYRFDIGHTCNETF